jgi:hypothetical protein
MSMVPPDQMSKQSGVTNLSLLTVYITKMSMVLPDQMSKQSRVTNLSLLSRLYYLDVYGATRPNE